MLFSQPLDRKYTKTPNVFFEEVLCAKGTTFNEAKLMGYLIRNTLGYNHGASWINVSRSKLQSAGISYGSINPTIQSCIKKGWILEVKQGDKGREERYLFLRTPRNEQIVHGLEKGDITLANLGSLIDMDIEDLGVQYGVRAQIAAATGIKNKQAVHFCTSYAQDKQSYTSPEPVSTANNEQAPCTANEEDPYSNSEHVNTASIQSYHGLEVPLKIMTLKNKSIKDNKQNHNKQQQPHSVVVKNTPISAHDKFNYSVGENTSEGSLALALPAKKVEHIDEVVIIQDRITNLFGHTISRKNVETLMLLASKEDIGLTAMIENTYTYHTQVKPCRNVFGAIHYAIVNGGWEIPDTTTGLYSHCKLFAAQEQTPRSTYNLPPVEVLKRMYGLS